MIFRQEGDMGRYVAFNDPGQPGAGFSSLEEYLAAGNQMPQLQTMGPLKAAELEDLRKNNPINMFNVSLPGESGAELTPLNPMSGVQQATPSTPNTESFFQVTPPSVPVSEQTPLSGLPPSNNFLDDTRDKTLPQISDPAGLQDAIRTVDPIVSGDNSIASTQQVPFDRVGQQMINFEDMFGPLNTRLNKIEEGIASLLDNRGQGLNMNTMPNRNLNNFFQEPVGRFPFRSFYG